MRAYTTLGDGIDELKNEERPQFVAKSVRLHGIETGSREMFEEMNRFIESRRLRPVIDSTFGFGEVRAALTRLESAKHFGKVVVEF